MIIRKTDVFLVVGMVFCSCYGGEVVKTNPAECSLSIEPGAAFFVVLGKDWSQWASKAEPRKFKLTVIDQKGKKASGYPGSAGEKEELGLNLLVNGGMEMFATEEGELLGWENSRGKTVCEKALMRPGGSGKSALKLIVAEGKSPWGSSCVISQTITVDKGRLYKLSGWLRNGDAASVCMKAQDTIDGSNDIHTPTHAAQEWKEYAGYYTPCRSIDEEAWIYFIVTGEDGKYGYADDMSFCEVKAGGRNFIRVYSGKTGDQQSFSFVEKGFNPYRVVQFMVEESEQVEGGVK